MLHKPNAKPYLIIGIICAVMAIMSIFFKLSSRNFNIFFTLAMLLSAIGSLVWVYSVKLRAYTSAQKYEEMFKVQSERPALLYNLGMAGLISGDKGYVLEKLEEFLKKYPEHSLASKVSDLKIKLQLKRRISNDELCYAGEQLRRENKLAEAEKEFQDEVAINPEADWAYYGLGLVYAQMGNIPRAREYFAKFKEIIPDQRDIRGAIAKKIIKNLDNGKNVDVNQLIEKSLKKSRWVTYMCFSYLAIVLILALIFVLAKGC